MKNSLTRNSAGKRFVAKDVATMLGYKDTDKAVRMHCKYAKLLKPANSAGLTSSPRGINIIPEPDVWRLIIKSTLPEAQKVEEWVFDDVLPEIRKNDGYMTDEKSSFKLGKEYYRFKRCYSWKSKPRHCFLDISIIFSIINPYV